MYREQYKSSPDCNHILSSIVNKLQSIRDMFVNNITGYVLMTMLLTVDRYQAQVKFKLF